MTRNLRLRDGRPLRLGAELASAGEGTVLEVAGHPEWVAKIFHTHLSDLSTKAAKVRDMAAAQPQRAIQSDGSVVLAWPEQTIIEQGRVVGFVMRRIDTSIAVEIHKISNPVDRANPNPRGPQWPRAVTWRHLVNIAANLCRAVETAHGAGAIIGDFNERNILVSNTTLVSLVDCDSFQYVNPAGRTYFCGVARPEFLAPELATANLKTQQRQRESDLFVLAVHIHQLLMAGNHPFGRGNWAGTGNMPDHLTLASGGHWAGGIRSKLRTHSAAPAPSILPTRIQELFERALGRGSSTPSIRPSAAEWSRELRNLTFTNCTTNSLHVFSSHHRTCPWCALGRSHTRPQPPPTAVPRQQPTPKINTAKPSPPIPATPAAPPPPSPAQQSATHRRAAERTKSDIRMIVTWFCLCVTVLVPYLIGHFGIRRTNWLPADSALFDARVRGLATYFLPDYLSGVITLSLLLSAFMLLRNWNRRTPNIIGAAALTLACAFVVYPFALEKWRTAETESIHKLATTAFPFDDQYYTCDSAIYEIEWTNGAEEPWQIYLARTQNSQDGCNLVEVYRGWTYIGSFAMHDGDVFTPGTWNNTDISSGGFTLDQIWINLATDNGGTLRFTLAGAGRAEFTVEY